MQKTLVPFPICFCASLTFVAPAMRPQAYDVPHLSPTCPAYGFAPVARLTHYRSLNAQTFVGAAGPFRPSRWMVEQTHPSGEETLGRRTEKKQQLGHKTPQSSVLVVPSGHRAGLAAPSTALIQVPQTLALCPWPMDLVDISDLRCL